jgi:hypothetical protein
LKSLDEILRDRRAVREFAEIPIQSSVLKFIVSGSLCALARRVATGGPACFVRPFVAVARGDSDLPSGIYEVDSTTGTYLPRGAFNNSLAEECTNQRTLAAAPATLFMIGNLRSALTERGTRGYAELALYAGAAIGEAWLAATSKKVVGTAGGGVIAAGLRRAAGMDGFHECPFLALHLGQKLNCES